MIDSVTFPLPQRPRRRASSGLPEGNGKAPRWFSSREYLGRQRPRPLAGRGGAVPGGLHRPAPDLLPRHRRHHRGRGPAPHDRAPVAPRARRIAGALAWLQADPARRATSGSRASAWARGRAPLRVQRARLEAAVAFYGVPPAQFTDWKKADAPHPGALLATDQWAKPAAAEEIRDARRPRQDDGPPSTTPSTPS